MEERRTEPAFPWAGLLTLAVAVAGTAALLLSVPVPLERMIQTWPLSRSAGLVAYLYLWASVCLGLLQSMGMLRSLSTPAIRVDMHAFLSLGAIYATVFHAVILLWDHYLPFHWDDILLPFASDYAPMLVGFGGVAFYLALAATVTTYLRPWFSARTWRAIHRFSLFGFLLALVHGVALGTDARSPVVMLMYAGTGLSALVLAAARFAKRLPSPTHAPR
jgi:sulfoxide reductase heme-binding subunit YedZ